VKNGVKKFNTKRKRYKKSKYFCSKAEGIGVNNNIVASNIGVTQLVLKH